MKTRRIASNIIKISIIVIGLLVIVIVAGFYSLPTLLKAKLPEIIEQETGRKSSIANIQLALSPFQLSLDGFEIKDKNGQPLAAFETFYIQIDVLQSIKQSELVIDNASLKKPSVRIVKQKNGTFNFQDLLKNKADAKKQDSNIFPVTIAKLSLLEGKLAWEDVHLDKPVKEDIVPINLDIENFNTHTDKPFNLSLSLTLSSIGHLDWKGAVVNRPLSSEGHIKFDKVSLERALALALLTQDLQGTGVFEADYKASYVANNFKLAVNKAKLDLQDFHYAQNGQTVKALKVNHETDLTFNYTDKSWQLEASKAKLDSHDLGLLQEKMLVKIPSVALEAGYKVLFVDNKLNVIVNEGKFDSRDARLSEQGQEKALAKIPVIALRGIDFNLNSRELTVDSVSANDVDFQAWLNPDGVINYQTLFISSKANAIGPEKIESAQSPWTIKLNNITLTNFGAVFEDRTLKKPVTINFKAIDFKLKNYSNKTSANLPFQLNLGVNKTGLIKLNGDTVIDPLAAKIDIEVKDIELEKFQPYYDKFVRLDVIDGALNINGKVLLAKPAQDKLDVKFNGDASIASFLTRDQKVNKDFVKWENFTLKNMAIDLPANRYTAAALDIDRPYARVTIRKDKTVNVADIVIGDKSDPEIRIKTAKKKPIDPNKPYFKLGKIKVTDGSSDFTDLSLILPFAAHIQSLDGGVSGVSSEQKSIVNVALKGNAYDLAPVDVKGVISPYLGDYHVELNFYGLPMPLVSPYMVQFAGYKVEKGKMTLGLKYDVVNRQLTASNSLLIDQFELGEKVENPNAVSLPLKLAVALLKDSNGKIKFDVPITGSLEDPKFNIGAIITDALFNAITKIVTSPFKAMASLLGSEEDLSTISFTAGVSTLQKTELRKLDGVAKALQERPVLSLEIKGAAFQMQDWPAIRDDALYDQLKKRRADEINKEGVRKIRPEYVELSEQDYQRLLAEMFMEKFPLLAEKSFFGTPQLKNPKAGDFYEIAKQKLFEIIKPEEQRLKELAAARAQAIAKYIVQKGGVPQERVFILDTVVDPERSDKEIVSMLSLKAD